MIAIDSSAILAIAFEEEEAESFKQAIAHNHCLIGWATLFEVHIVLRNRLGSRQFRSLKELMIGTKMTEVPFDGALFALACEAYDKYGRGRGAAGLNFGDCLTYAVAKFHDVPLLFKGDDFRHTDLRPAIP
jgi:ribonuclease VapC